MKKCIYTICLLITNITVISAQPIVKSVGFSAGYYNPSMEYWNESSLFASGNEQFNGSFIIGINARVDVYKGIIFSLNADYCKETIKKDNFTAGSILNFKELSIQLYSITGSIAYYIPHPYTKYFKMYGGAGGGILFINTTQKTSYKTETNDEITKDGNDYIWHLLIGIDKEILPYISAGVEFKYALGNYTQQVETSPGQLVDEEISLAGPQILITINYLF